jgi:hypothetical protein
MRTLLLLLALAVVLTSCMAERVHILTVEEGHAYDSSTPRNNARPILSGPTKGQQRRGLPVKSGIHKGKFFTRMQR